MLSVREVIGPVSSWPIVTCKGVRWYVAPVYVPAMSRKRVSAVLEEWGCEAPTRELVDAIWAAADLKLDPWKVARTPNTRENMQSERALADQLDRLEAMVYGEDFTLLAGSHKDIAWVSPARMDLYGWHQLNGVVIEKGLTSHDDEYEDYSQGLRLVRMVLEE